MKKFAILIVVALLAISSAWAHNEVVPASASFDVIVITPLGISATADVTLPEIIQGQTRSWPAKTITFEITGQASHLINVTIGSVAVVKPTLTAGDLILTQTTGGVAPSALGSDGKAYVAWSCTGANAVAASLGTYTFSLKVEANYGGM